MSVLEEILAVTTIIANVIVIASSIKNLIESRK